MELVVYLLLILTSMVGLAFIIERGLALRWRKVVPPEVEAAVESCQTPEDVPMLRRVCETHDSPISRLLLISSNHLDWPKAEAVDARELPRIVREQPHRADTEIRQDADAETVLALIRAEAKTLVGFDGVVSLILQRVGADLIGQPDAASFLVQVENDAASFGCDACHRRMQLRTAVAAGRMEHIACQARRVKTNEHTVAVADVTTDERDVFLAVGEVLVRVNLEFAEVCRQLRLGRLDLGTRLERHRAQRVSLAVEDHAAIGIDQDARTGSRVVIGCLLCGRQLCHVTRTA